MLLQEFAHILQDHLARQSVSPKVGNGVDEGGKVNTSKYRPRDTAKITASGSLAGYEYWLLHRPQRAWHGKIVYMWRSKTKNKKTHTYCSGHKQINVATSSSLRRPQKLQTTYSNLPRSLFLFLPARSPQGRYQSVSHRGWKASRWEPRRPPFGRCPPDTARPSQRRRTVRVP